MRVGLAVSSDKFTGAAAVAEQWLRALLAAGCEARLLFVAGANLERRIGQNTWAFPDLVKDRRLSDVQTNFRALRRLADSSDIVMSFLPHDHFEAVIAGVDRRTPLVRAFRNPRHLRKDPLHRWVSRRCAGALSPFESLSERTKKMVGGRPTASIPAPVDDRFGPGPDPQEAKQKLGFDQTAPLIGMVGKMAQGRGFELLLDAAARTRTRCRILAIGHGELKPSLEQKAHRLGISDRITWAGKREDDLPLLFAAMDAVVFAAPGSDWGHRAISEAQGCGRPVIAVPVPGVEDLLEHDRTGLVADGAQGIAGAFDRLIEDPDMALRLGRSALKTAADRRYLVVGKELIAFLEGINQKDRFPEGETRLD